MSSLQSTGFILLVGDEMVLLMRSSSTLTSLVVLMITKIILGTFILQQLVVFLIYLILETKAWLITKLY